MTSTGEDSTGEELSFPLPSPTPLEPSPVLRRLRDGCPVARVRLPTGHSAWLVSGYEDNRSVLGDPRFSRAAAAAPGAPRARRIPLEAGALTTLDPPEHSRVRRLVMGAFTGARVSLLQERVERVTEELLDEMERLGPPADLITQLALPLPFTIICEILGVPVDHHDRFRDWAETYLDLTGRSASEIEQAAGNLGDFLRTLIDGKRRSPGADLLSSLVVARDEERLSEQELVALGVTLLVAGYETVACYLAGAVIALLRHPGQLERVRTHPDLLPGAVEELLRYVPAPATGGTIRVALQDVELAGVRIRPGDAVLPALTSANRDASVFTEPDRLDLARTPNHHMAFGHGPHRCLGAPLARAQLNIALRNLLRRFPGLHSAVAIEDLSWRAGGMLRRPVSLPIAW